jgi:hypothetical protein
MNFDETITTLQFASRAIKIRVNAKINEKIELKKMKEKLNDIIKIQKMDYILSENKRLEKDANDLKSSFLHFKDDLKRAKSKNERRGYDGDESHINASKYGSQINNAISHTNRSQFSSVMSMENISDYCAITKKFQLMILHLQSELAKSAVKNNFLEEENTNLKEKLAKLTK